MRNKLIILITSLFILCGCANEIRFNPPIGQVLLRDLDFIFYKYGYKYKVSDKLSKIADLCIDRHVYNDAYGSVNVDEFIDQLRIVCLWNYGFNVKVIKVNELVIIDYDDSDEIYEKLPKIEINAAQQGDAPEPAMPAR
jgi:hypothetical protein